MNLSAPSLDVDDVICAVFKQKRNKAAGPNGIYMESYIFGGHRLHVLLCLAFNIFMKFGYLLSFFCLSTIMLLIKNKSGDSADLNNYRAIAIFNSATKIIKVVLADIIESVDNADLYQFGFRKGLSTGLCTNVLKSTVKYYRQQGSHVFCSFIDFSKAFDLIDYWLLFYKMLDCSRAAIYNIAIRLLCFWYSNHLMLVRWQGVESRCFYVANGVRQGGILSPYLFCVYVKDLISEVVLSGVGCSSRGDFIVNLLAYADDMVLLAPSWQGLQFLLSVMNKTAKKLDINFNTKNRLYDY